MHGKQKTKRRILKILRIEAKFHKAKPERKSGRYQFLSGRILAGLLVKEPKTRKEWSQYESIIWIVLLFESSLFTSKI